MLYVLLFFIFVFGTIIGSFLNVVIYRLHTKEPIVKARSHCSQCGHILEWYELIPVFSFLVQRGKCRACSSRIPVQYPLVELGTGIIFLLIAMTNQIPIIQLPKLTYFFAISSVLIVIFIYDLKHYIIPDKVLYPAIGIVLLYRLFEFLNFGNWDLIGIWSLGFGHSAPLAESIFSALASAVFFFAIFAFSKGAALGFGDVKFAFFMGLFLGWPNILVGLFLAWVLGGIIGIGLLLSRKKGLKSQVPFGPFLVIGTFAAMLWGEELVRWYLVIIF